MLKCHYDRNGDCKSIILNTFIHTHKVEEYKLIGNINKNCCKIKLVQSDPG